MMWRPLLCRNTARLGRAVDVQACRRIATLPQPPSFLTMLTIAAGLPLALWTYKCCIMVMFQRRIIYMGYAPLGARRDRLSDVPQQYLRGLQCQEVTLDSDPRIVLAGLLVQPERSSEQNVDTVIIYLQGNAGNPLHRLPVFQQLLCHAISLQQRSKTAILAVAPRSYWSSTLQRPTQSGIIRDYQSVLSYALKRFPLARIVLYGHSLGGAAAICLLAETDRSGPFSLPSKECERICGLILENPFPSIPAMVRALYPQKWLPYHYLAPFVFDRWDALSALNSPEANTVLGRLVPKMLLMLSEHDEVVPIDMGKQLFEAATKGRCDVGRKVTIRSALHENAWMKKSWCDEMRTYFQTFDT